MDLLSKYWVVYRWFWRLGIEDYIVGICLLHTLDLNLH